MPTGSRQTASRKALLDAFELLLVRHGVGGVGVNAVLETAGVGKQLLYRYFGDLHGLATAWSEERRDPLALGERRERLSTALQKLPRDKRIGEILVDYASMLREHPWAVQVMLAEMSHADTLGRSMGEIRRAIGRTHESLLLEAGTMTSNAAVGRAFALHAAAAYLAMRAKLAPDYNGLDLASSAGWDAAMDILRSAGSPRQKKSLKRKSQRTGVRSRRSP